ncbi:hypothetical protein V3C99_015629 [Haemonchus contortus]|nr:unnamed protein product [Haemonchus contortus]
MIPHKNQLAKSWQFQALQNVPLVSDLCARLCCLGVVFLGTPDSSMLRSNTNVVTVEEDHTDGEPPKGDSPFLSSGKEQSCTRTTSIAHRLLQLCDQFESEFEGGGVYCDAAESDCVDELVLLPILVSESLREWCGACT